MEDLFFHQDWLMKVRRCRVIDAPLYQYHINFGGIMFSPAIKDYYMDVFHVQNAIFDKLNAEGVADACRLELAYIYYKKAFVTPMEYLLYGEPLIPYDSGNAHLVRKTLLDRFPDILQNPYVMQDQSEDNRIMMRAVQGEDVRELVRS